MGKENGKRRDREEEGEGEEERKGGGTDPPSPLSPVLQESDQGLY